jgi:hypothetical protein
MSAVIPDIRHRESILVFFPIDPRLPIAGMTKKCVMPDIRYRASIRALFPIDHRYLLAGMTGGGVSPVGHQWTSPRHYVFIQCHPDPTVALRHPWPCLFLVEMSG